MHASHRLARALAALEVRVLNIESTVETHSAQLGDACFMSEHNAKVSRLAVEIDRLKEELEQRTKRWATR